MGIAIAIGVGILILLGLGGAGDGLLDCNAEHRGFVIIAVQQADGTWDAAATQPRVGGAVFTARGFSSCETALNGARDLIDESLNGSSDSSFEDQEQGSIDKKKLVGDDEEQADRLDPDPVNWVGNCRVFVQGYGWYEPGGGYNDAVFGSFQDIANELTALGYPTSVSGNGLTGDAVFNFQIRGRQLALSGLAGAPDELMDNVPGICTLRALGFARAMRRANTWSK